MELIFFYQKENSNVPLLECQLLWLKSNVFFFSFLRLGDSQLQQSLSRSKDEHFMHTEYIATNYTEYIATNYTENVNYTNHPCGNRVNCC